MKTRPSVSDVEKAKQVIIDELCSDGAKEHMSSLRLITTVITRMSDHNPIPPPEGYDFVSPNLNQIKLEFAAREALNTLHASGEIVDAGARESGPSNKNVILHGERSISGNLALPSVYKAYHMSTLFRTDTE